LVGLLFVAYGAASYLCFLAAFLYAIAFVGDLPVPRTIDGGTPGALLPSLAIDAALLGVFAIQHSVMARPAFKRWWTRMVPPPVERSTYVLFASLALGLLYVEWRPLPQVIWALDGAAGAVAQGVGWTGWVIVLLSSFLISHFHLFGLTQVTNRLLRREAGPVEFTTPGFYRFIRHPLYLGFILAFWATPVMTLGHLVFALATTAYILIAIQFEERDLVGEFGDRYLSYRRSAGMLLPKIGGARR
jgi:protein-S-isoprenylcysteine O-methyltransferase Ste14